jgi:hypothetical protein
MPSGLLKEAAATRERARRARRLAEGLNDVDKARLLLHAEELQDLAAELERKIGSKPEA